MKGENNVKEIQIKNFRSLKDTGVQTLSPITLLVGENSSGKSTFLRAFPLLKQSISKKTSGPILWAGDIDDYVDFGSFEETVTNDKSNSIVFSFKFQFDIWENARLHRFFEIDEPIDSKSRSSSDITYKITITSTKGKERVSHMSLSVNSTYIDFDLDDKTIKTGSGLYYTEKSMLSETDEEITSHRIDFRRYYVRSHSFGFTLPNISEFTRKIQELLTNEKSEKEDPFLIREFIPQVGLMLTYLDTIPLLNKKTTKQRRIPEGYATLFNNIVSFLQDNDHSELREMAKLIGIYEIFPAIDEYINSYFKQVHYIAPLRATAERYYRLRNLAVDEVDYQGKNLPILINSLTKKQLDEFHLWTDKHFGFIVNTDKSKGHLSLQIKLHDSDKSINLSDTGFGYSQVLPIITQLWVLSSRKNSTSQTYWDRNQQIPLVIAIEQPELHLHPAVQARLAKTFIACIELARKNNYELQLLIETHSETIVNYFGRAIAKKQLNPEDVSVILFEKNAGDSVTTVRNSSYDVDGFLTNWPYGFFSSED